MKSKVLCHCFECGFNLEIVNDNYKIISCGNFFEHNTIGKNKRCLEKGEKVIRVDKELGSNGDFVFRLVTVYRS